MATEARALAELIAKLEPALRDAFRAAMQDLRDGIDRQGLIAALSRGDVDAAIRALNIEPAVFNTYLTAHISGFAQAGQLFASMIPTASALASTFRFDMANPRADRRIRELAGDRIAGYTQEQTEIARRVISEGYSRGDGPQNIAVEIAGRIDRVTWRRQGGIVGLSDPQAGYVQSMRERLLSGDPRQMRKVLAGMTLRDKRFDTAIVKAIEEGRPVPRAVVEKMTARYADRLLRRRAEDIARTETAQGVMGARAESYRQAIDKEGLAADAITKVWVHSGAGDDDARLQHMLMNGEKVVGLETPFRLPDGTLMQHAHDPSGGARHNINCRCDTRFEIDFTRGVL